MNQTLAGQAFHQPADRLRTLNAIGRAVSAALDLQAVYDTIYDQISSVLHTPMFFIALRQPDGGNIRLPYAREGNEVIRGATFPHSGNLTSLCIEAGTPLLFHTYDKHRQYARAHGLPEPMASDGSFLPAESYLYVPLNTGSETIGALSVQSMRPYAYTHDDVQTLSVIASQAAVAIENARLYQQSQDAVRQMQVLLRVAQTVNSSLDLQTVLDSILAGVREVLPCSRASILMPNYVHGRLEVAGRTGARQDDKEMAIPFGQGVVGAVFEHGEAVAAPGACSGPVCSEIAVPLRQGEAVVGVLQVERAGENAFSEQDLGLLTLFASQAAIAIENARLFSAQQNRVFELATIQSIVRQLTPLHEIPAIVAVINRELKRLIDYHSCRIFLLDREREDLVLIGEPELRLKIDEGLTGWIARTGASQMIPNTLADPRAIQIDGTPRRAESIIGAPLVSESGVQGVITLSKLGAGQFDENALRLLEIVAAQTALAVDRARLYAELRQEAITDELTGVYNRRYLQERFREEAARAQRNRTLLVALLLDIDKFKQINDTYGHDAGDIVLREVAAQIRGVVRTEDVVARYGGEEFCVLLPAVPIPDAVQVAERLRRVLGKHRFPLDVGRGRLTVSVGMAIWEEGEQANELFSRADEAMYAAKHRGGNAVVSHELVSHEL